MSDESAQPSNSPKAKQKREPGIGAKATTLWLRQDQRERLAQEPNASTLVRNLIDGYYGITPPTA